MLIPNIVAAIICFFCAIQYFITSCTEDKQAATKADFYDPKNEDDFLF